MSRKGALTIITVATEERAYMFDVLNWEKPYSVLDLPKYFKS